ncbi:type II toxin-antitoxin system RelB/DinJ family antitoxin [Polynucleobacter sp. MG-6-Vaara-E2]|uniref:type II toxin-antitoxin system RelB/DinJ family antitoxin n=1 Tax=Polynucleobacter sp. MG-6-Vaara-E2 TaxID=2576932 RepID=UPI001BFD4412|nr:type II toxin-antitoxin system RelB/DinJ family antitoxin [Polynucleobacter sp. MG-6-Vaara-E2]QWD96937.1 type II toxin-antitoxin system RelB/DinJ family antitoxin [Polynucleobacter sp. MG-6-Vaara-E2]
MLEVTVRCRIDEQTKEKVSLVLDQIGMTLSTAIRLFLKRIAEDGTFPFELNRSTHQDVSGIKAALIHMINSGQVSAQAFAGLLGDDFDSKANPSSGDARKGLLSAIPVKANKARNP